MSEMKSDQSRLGSFLSQSTSKCFDLYDNVNALSRHRQSLTGTSEFQAIGMAYRSRLQILMAV